MRLLILSDTHGKHSLVPDLPEADVFIFAGDLMNSGRYLEEVSSFNTWLDKVPVYKERRLLIAGNHCIAFDGAHPESSPNKSKKARDIITNGIYLQDDSLVIDGVKFWFSPRTPYFLGWAFNSQRGADIKTFWDRIPQDTDVLVTHGPPHGILDKVQPNIYHKEVTHVGCEELKKTVQTILPSLHIFGHIHGERGHHTEGILMKPTTYINASFLDEQYKPHKGPGYFLVDLIPTPHLASKYRVEIIEG